ncbi:hypothetical protein PtB15_2B613 [Puccinia triticina]|nr:hypothetical protein PtB15_2B613 [Puccinia triticina]
MPNQPLSNPSQLSEASAEVTAKQQASAKPTKKRGRPRKKKHDAAKIKLTPLTDADWERIAARSAANFTSHWNAENERYQRLNPNGGRALQIEVGRPPNNPVSSLDVGSPQNSATPQEVAASQRAIAIQKAAATKRATAATLAAAKHQAILNSVAAKTAVAPRKDVAKRMGTRRSARTRRV